MRISKKLLIKAVTLLLAWGLLIGAIVSTTYGWFYNPGSIGVDKISGTILTNYFHTGNGTKEHPFVITRPIHYYNLVNLYQRVPKYSDNHFYFQVGYDLDGSGVMKVYNYNDAGEAATTGELYSTTLNLKYYSGTNALLPIGTAENPFLGVFDGQGITLAGFTVTTNSDTLTAKDKCDVGIFGFVGAGLDIDEDGEIDDGYTYETKNVDGKTVKTKVVDETTGEPLYDEAKDTESAAIKNVFFKNVTIDLTGASAATMEQTKHNATVHNLAGDGEDAQLTPYVGYIAGHIVSSAQVSGVYVNNITVTGGAAAVSNYGYFGYVEDKSGSGAVATLGSEMATQFAKGDDIGWGGSIGMDEIYKRIDGYRGSATTFRLPTEQTGEFHHFDDGVEDESKFTTTQTNASNANSSIYFDAANPLKGRIVYGQTAANYLWGLRTYTRNYTITNEYVTSTVLDGYCAAAVAKDGKTQYLRFEGADAKKTDNEANKTLLQVDSDGWVYYKYNGQTYYIYPEYEQNGNLKEKIKSSTNKNQTYLFQISDGKLCVYQRSTKSSRERYVTADDKGDFKANGSAQNAVAVTNTVYTTTTETIVDHVITHNTGGSYIPLNVYKSADEITDEVRAKLPDENLVVGAPKLNNTGYIIGGTKDQSDNYGSAVRIASNYDYGDISRGLGGSSSYSGSNLQILTRTKDTGGVVYIQDDYNKQTSLTNDQKSLGYITQSSKNGTRYSVDSLGLKMYTGSRENLDEQFKVNTSTLYVMRFNEFLIDINNTITAEKVLLNGEVKENYVFPESCIDFQLKESGYINFFGGGFRGGSCNAFFSLYHVIRDENDNITSLKRLSKIYGTGNVKDPYIYKYTDGSYAVLDKETNKYVATSLLSGYTEYFDMQWVEAPGFTGIDNTVWYFEIPVNEGEYALGAVDGRTGAYMFYLDVGANGGGAVKTKISPEGVGAVSSFNVEFREAPATETESATLPENTILLFSYDAPATASDKFSVSVSFDPNPKDCQDKTDYYSKGLYNITIVNTSGTEVPMIIFLCDDDDDPDNDFDYAYKLVYNDTVYMNGDYDFWRSCQQIYLLDAVYTESTVN